MRVSPQAYGVAIFATYPLVVTLPITLATGPYRYDSILSLCTSTFLTVRTFSLIGARPPGISAVQRSARWPRSALLFCPRDVPLQDTFDCFFDYGFHGVEVISEPVYLAYCTDDDVRPAGAPFGVVFL